MREERKLVEAYAQSNAVILSIFIKKVIVIILILYCLLLSGCRFEKKSKESAISLIDRLIKITIPDEFELIEHYYSNIFLHGRLPNYFIFKADSEPIDFLDEYGFSENDNKTIEEKIIDIVSKESEAYNLKIPEKNLIDFTKEYLLVYQEDNYYLVYYVESYELIIYIVAH